MKYDYMSGGAYVPTGAAAIQLSKALIAAKEAKKDKTYPHCSHCRNHEAPWFGSKTLTSDGNGHTVPCGQCQTIREHGYASDGNPARDGLIQAIEADLDMWDEPCDKVHSASGHCEWTETS